MATLRDLEDKDEINSSAERHLVTRTGGTIRKWVRKDAPVVDVARVASAPAAPPKAMGAWFFQDDGAGKMQFCVRFPSGVTQVLATEP